MRIAKPALVVLAACIVVGESQSSNGAVLFNISGGTAPGFTYSSDSGSNNVINAPGAPTTGSTVFDGSNTSAWIGSTQSAPAVLSVTGLNVNQSYIIQWAYIGSEAANQNLFQVTNTGAIVIATSVPSAGFVADNRNNNCCASLNPAPTVNIGATVYENTSVAPSIPGFSIWDTITGKSVTNGTANPAPNLGAANLIFAYLTPDTDPAHTAAGIFWDLTTTPTNTIVFGFNDNGAGDDDHDDFVGIATIIAGSTVTTPIPGALPLFGSALGGVMGLLAWRKKRRSPGTDPGPRLRKLR
jgi:hypothetical protein